MFSAAGVADQESTECQNVDGEYIRFQHPAGISGQSEDIESIQFFGKKIKLSL
jgi:hypothetical protein